MKIITTSILLIVTLLLVPIFTYYFASPLGSLEWQVVNKLIIVLGCVWAYCFIVGELTANNSQVDKLWSLIPIVYTWIVAYYGGFSTRLVLMSVMVSVWGFRLTYNFSRHGAYRWKFWEGKEDYRWEILRQKKEFQPKWKWTLFNFFFISGYQNILILLFTIPSIIALQYNDTPISWLDYVATLLMLFFIVYETIADQQHWEFQSKKAEMIKDKEELVGDFKKGFLTKGLWSLSRHPNYFGEQAIWISFYLFGVSASGEIFNWSIVGCLLLVVLFQSSSTFGEEISASKYPEYEEYQKHVSRFFPMKRKTN